MVDPGCWEWKDKPNTCWELSKQNHSGQTSFVAAGGKVQAVAPEKINVQILAPACV